MSEVADAMKFEFLPNEILFQCFEYLNGVDIFYAFAQLNSRFNRLIRSLSLSVDFRHIQRLASEKFLMKILLDDQMKKRIYSLHLSNKYSSTNIQIFLSIFSLEKFLHLRSLTLTGATENDLSQLKLILPLMSQLSHFQSIEFNGYYDEALSILPANQIRILKISIVPRDLHLWNQFSLISRLTISKCDFVALSGILKHTAELIYLSVKHLDRDGYGLINEEIRLPKLKYLIITCFRRGFDDFAILFNQTPKLKSLIISNYDDVTMMDANRWQDLITSSLPCLNIFQFKFHCSRSDEHFDILEIFHSFQDDFWCKKHRWLTEYSLSNDLLSIYTIPYISNSYDLTVDTNRYYDQSADNVDVFGNVRNLTIDSGVITKKCQYHFSHLTSLTVQKPWPWSGDEFFQPKHIEQLKTIVNLSTVKHITLSHNVQLQSPDVLREFLKETPQISSIKIDPNELISLFDDERLSKYLNEKIQTLDVHMIGESSFNNLSGLNELCRVFSNVERLTCTINQQKSLALLFQYLPKLFFVKVFYSRSSINQNFISYLEEEAQKSDIQILTEFQNGANPSLSIWIVRK